MGDEPRDYYGLGPPWQSPLASERALGATFEFGRRVYGDTYRVPLAPSVRTEFLETS